ncbi:hypothetical protein Kpol_431p3 [Vanderwaltozyma polyspora DSM 70294]|uniref:Vacuolar protein sorting-associated protein 20 n=1 Tax=Vanderwaltozyma polyspora (strain ATCC 22028 / DSM 70294 / BCRC 21397 / CBS 2163 / NBRC 10782 / NRRL Y-8283 / UCD 57-17) TaxID=436907 RepID=A7TRM4_VANPO|nr:uncharacterized protein Kpol_431p3 [Vanderwaltozyma polyspora DSM 70294]EDO15076.1 hypothetical protein Kpol_431p3 [Vanderwaltozyma polyspora DSM 70294]
MGQRGSKVQVTGTDRAILQLKVSKDEIHKYTKKTELLINNERSRLKEMIKNNPKTYKNNASVRFLLKRIHYQEDLLQKASDQLINLENMVSNIEFKLVERRFVEGLKSGNEILKKLNKELANADELMDDVQEQIAYQNEINDILSRSIVGVENFEDEIDRELDDLEQEIIGKPISIDNMPSTEGLPKLEQEIPEEQKIPGETKITEGANRGKVALLAD